MNTSFSIIGVNVFDGKSFHEKDITVEKGIISAEATNNSTTIDGTGKFLIPGLIDCHIHLRDVQVLQKLAHHGVTTALDMATWPPSVFKSFKNQHGLPDIRSAGVPATTPGSQHSRIPGLDQYLISDVSEVETWVKKRVDEGSDYIKIVSDIPGPSQDLMNALVASARDLGKMTVIHASRKVAFEMAVEAKPDFITHLPLDQPLEEGCVKAMKSAGIISVPTLAMDEAMPEKRGPPLNYASAKASFQTVLQAGIPILAGSDANATPICPIEHGKSLHRELRLMVDAGLSPAGALRAATQSPSVFGLADRGRVEEGFRADLVMLSRNPLDNIDNTRCIERVWIAGVEYERS